MTEDRPERSTRLPTWAATALAILLVGVVGALDYLTGQELGFSIFYLLPVAWGSWRSSARIGGAMAVLGSVVWYLNETAGDQIFTHPAVPLWNAGIRLGFFVLAVYAVARVRTALERERSLSLADALTGLANARAFHEISSRELERSRRHGAPLSVCYIDLDNFKAVNDTRGHLGGDEVLKTIADSLRSAVRTVDLPARLGGDEFAVLLPDTATEGARAVVGRMHGALLEAAEQLAVPVTFSIGVVTFHQPPQAPEELVRQADRLMYAVKRSGKHAVRYEVIRAHPADEPLVEDGTAARLAHESLDGSCGMP